jgi:hypothetical protein
MASLIIGTALVSFASLYLLHVKVVMVMVTSCAEKTQRCESKFDPGLVSTYSMTSIISCPIIDHTDVQQYISQFAS